MTHAPRELRGRLAASVGAAALALTGVLSGCPQPEPVAEPPKAVATVDGEAITVEELSRDLRRVAQNGGSLGVHSDKELETLRRRLLEQRIDQVLLLQEARRKQLSVGHEEVERALLRVRADYPDRAFEDLLADEGILLEDLREDVRRRLLIERLAAQEIAGRVSVGDDEIEAWFEAHPEFAEEGEKVHALQIVVQTEEEAEALRRQLERGADFEALARAHSLAPEAAEGGDLGWFPRGVMPPPIDETAFALRTGRVSEVVESPYGYHLFKVVGRKKATRRELDPEMRARIERRLRREKEEAAQKDYLSRLREPAAIEIHEDVMEQVR